MKYMRSIIMMIVIVVTISSFLVTACAPKATTSESGERETAQYETEEPASTTEAAETTAEKPKKEKILVGWSFCNLISLFWQAQEDHIKKYSDDKGHEYIITDAEEDPAKQDSQVKDLIARNVDAVVVIPQDQEAICASIDAVRAAGKPIISMSRSPACLDKVDYDVGSDSYQFASAIVDWLAKQADEKNITINLLLLVGDLRDNNAVLRRTGVIENVPKYADKIKVVTEIPTEWNQDKALSGTTNALQANPEINAIFVPSDYLLPSVIASLKAANKLLNFDDPNHIILATIDGDPYGVAQIKAGYADVDVAHDPWGWVEMSLDAAVKLVNGETLPSKKDVQVPVVATRDNVESLGDKLWGNVYKITE